MAKAKVIQFKYPLPKFSRGDSNFETLEIIQRGLYGVDCDYMDKSEINELITTIFKYAPKFTIEDFCTVYSYHHKIDFVELLAKFLGVGFNSMHFSVQEDTLIKAFYPTYGRYTNKIVADVMLHNLKVEDYSMKSEREIQDRVDYLQQGKNYFGSDMFKNVIPTNMKGLSHKKSTALICVDIPKNRPMYSNAEMKMLDLIKTYGLNFLPWKDMNEVDYYITRNTQQRAVYVGKCSKFTFNEGNVLIHFFNAHRAGLTILLGSKVMKSYNPNWNSYMDEVLKDCVKNMSNSIRLNTDSAMAVLYAPLIRMGKTVEECEARRQAIGVSVKYSRDEAESLMKNKTETFEQQSKNKQGFQRTPFSLGNTAIRFENKMGCKLADATDEMIEDFLNVHFPI